MLDGFYESIVRHIKTPKERLIGLAYAAGGILGAVAVFFIGLFMGLKYVGILGAGTVLFFAAQAIMFNNWEYEYIVTTGMVDIDKIIARRKRERMISFDCRDAEIIAPLNHGTYYAEYKHLPRLDYTAYTAHEENYFAVIERVGVKTCIIFQPTEQMVQMMKHYNPRNVFAA